MPATGGSRGSAARLDVRVEAEISQLVVSLRPVVEALGQTLGPNLELVLHDLRLPERSIVAIANGHVTGRQVGGPIIGGPVEDKALALVREPGRGARMLLNYGTRTRDGRELKSTSIIYYSAVTGEPIVALCVNYDLTDFQAARAALDLFIRTGELPPSARHRPSTQADRIDVERMIADTIERAVAAVGKPVALMDKQDKARVVASLDETGLFMIRNSVEHVARALGVSRFTVYSYLRERRARG